VHWNRLREEPRRRGDLQRACRRHRRLILHGLEALDWLLTAGGLDRVARHETYVDDSTGGWLYELQNAFTTAMNALHLALGCSPNCCRLPAQLAALKLLSSVMTLTGHVGVTLCIDAHHRASDQWAWACGADGLGGESCSIFWQALALVCGWAVTGAGRCSAPQRALTVRAGLASVNGTTEGGGRPGDSTCPCLSYIVPGWGLALHGKMTALVGTGCAVFQCTGG
jgi:hypothetical protein